MSDYIKRSTVLCYLDGVATADEMAMNIARAAAKRIPAEDVVPVLKGQCERLTFEGNFCDIALCTSVPGGSFCEDGYCSQRKVWERLKAYEDTGLTPEQVRSIAE